MNDRNVLFQEILAKNPVLVGTIGLCPVVAICTSLKDALILSAITILTLVVAQVLTSLVLKHLPQWARLGLYTLIGMLIVVPSMLVVNKLSPESMLALGIYFPLLAVNPLVVRNCEREAVEAELSRSVITSLCAGLGYSAVLVVVGLIREVFGAGTIWGVDIKFINPANALLMPAGGFIIIAYLASLLRIYFRKIDPEFADELIENSRTNIKGSKKAKLAFRGAKYADGSSPAPKKQRKAKVKEEPNASNVRKPSIEVMTLEQAEEIKAQSQPKVESTMQVELAPSSEIPEDDFDAAPIEETENNNENSGVASVIAIPTDSSLSEEKTSRFEFVTLDLGAETKKSSDAARFADAVRQSKEQKPQRQLNKRGQTRTIKDEKEGEE